MTHTETSLQEFLNNPDTTDSTQRILYPIFSTHDTVTFKTAVNIAKGVGGELLVLDLCTDDASQTAETSRIGRKLLQSHLDSNHVVDAHLIVKETDSPLKTAIKAAEQRNIQLVVLDEHTPELLGEGLLGDAADRMSKQTSCDVVSVTCTRGNSGISSVLVPLAEGRHSGLGVVVGGALANGANAVVDLFHVSSKKDDAEVTRVSDMFATARKRLPESVELNTWHLESPDVAEAIINESTHYDVTVIGKPSQGRLQEFVTGSITETVTEESENTVLTVQRGGTEGFKFDQA